MTIQEQALAKMQAKILKQQEKQVESLRAKYPHADVSTLTFDEVAKKYKTKITCALCGSTDRWVFTSDLFQITTCTACSGKAKDALKAAKKDLLVKAMALIKARQVEPMLVNSEK